MAASTPDGETGACEQEPARIPGGSPSVKFVDKNDDSEYTAPGQGGDGTSPDQSTTVSFEDEVPDGAWRKNNAKALGLFSARPPKHAGAGTSSAVKSVGSGFGMGFSSLVALPRRGVKEDGARGFCKGTAQGVSAAIILPISGIAVGAFQGCRGVVNSPKAVAQANKPTRWDEDRRIWCENNYSLTDDEALADKLRAQLETQKQFKMNAGGLRATPSTTPDRFLPPVDLTLYDVLDIEPSATQSEIKNAFYRLAKETHPDKCLDDAAAKEQFQVLGAAYLVLGDPERRHHYDRHGFSAQNAARPDDSDLDPSLFLTMVFGQAPLTQYIGELSSSNRFLFEDTPRATEGAFVDKYAEYRQYVREVDLAVLIKERIAPYLIDMPRQDFVKWCRSIRSEAIRMTKVWYHDPVVLSVGWAYMEAGKEFLGRKTTPMGVQGRFRSMRQSSKELGARVVAGTSAARSDKARRVVHYNIGELGSFAHDEEEYTPGGTRRLSKLDEDDEVVPMVTVDAQGNPKWSTPLKQDDRFAGATTPPESPTARAARLAVRQPSKLENGPVVELSPEEKRQRLSKAVERLLAACTRLAVVETLYTVERCCRKVMYDMSVPLEEQKRRAKGIIEVGRILFDEAQMRIWARSNGGEKLDGSKFMENVLRTATEAEEERKPLSVKSVDSGVRSDTI